MKIRVRYLLPFALSGESPHARHTESVAFVCSRLIGPLAYAAIPFVGIAQTSGVINHERQGRLDCISVRNSGAVSVLPTATHTVRITSQ